MNFSTLVKNYGNLSRLGQEIIKHKNVISQVPKKSLDAEFQKQEQRITDFIKTLEKTNTEWEKNPEIINKYWTGLS